MRIKCKKIHKTSITDGYLDNKFVLIKTNLAHKRYCGVLDGICLNRAYIEKNGLIYMSDGFYFPLAFLKAKCEIYQISFEDYQKFGKCQNVHDFDILWDNLYFEHE